MKKLILLVIIITFISCRKENSEKVNQDEIWTDYSLIYNSEFDETHARASFKHETFDGEGLTLSNKSEIKIDNIEGSYLSSVRWYESIFSGVKSSVEFSYTDLDDNSFLNTVELAPSIDLPEIDSIFKDSTMLLNWIGDEIKKDELVAFVLLDENLEANCVIGSDTLGKSGVYLDEDKLSVIVSDSVTIHFERWYYQDVNGTSAGGRTSGHYISFQKKVKVVTK